jgi:hypothetical protein
MLAMPATLSCFFVTPELGHVSDLLVRELSLREILPVPFGFEIVFECSLPGAHGPKGF